MALLLILLVVAAVIPTIARHAGIVTLTGDSPG